MKREPAGLTALVTGASSGLGEAIARDLAGRGHRCVLVSEDRAGLERVEREILADGGSALVIEADLFEAAAADRLHRRCRGSGVEVDVLVNCAGIHLSIEREFADPVAVEGIINLHVLAVTRLCLLFGKEMLDRGRGWILNVSSITAEFPDPASLTYGPTKRYILAFSRALHCEWKDRGVRVTCATPGGVDTGFFSRNEVFVPEVIRRTMIPASACARSAIDAMFRGRARVTPGISGKLQSLLLRLVSRPWTYPLIRRRYCSMKRAAAGRPPPAPDR